MTRIVIKDSVVSRESWEFEKKSRMIKYLNTHTSAQMNLVSCPLATSLNKTFKANLAILSQTTHGRTDTTKFASATRGNLLIRKCLKRQHFNEIHNSFRDHKS